jgi:hypothetical protein
MTARRLAASAAFHEPPHFKLVGEVTGIETIAVGRHIRQLERLQELYGKGRWRKMKGYALVRLASGAVRQVELHWYEAHGIGRRNLKIKQRRE